MTDQGDSPKPEKPSSSPDADVEEFRMSFGDHLDELRSRLIKALLGLVVTTVLSLVYARELLVILFRPLLVVLDAHGLPPSLMAMGVTDPFVGYLKMAILSGLIVATPWILYQAWMFVATGLYTYEQRFMRLFGPVSLLLFAGGVAFMYLVVLPIVLNFFVTFNQAFDMPELDRTGMFSLLFDSAEPAEAVPGDLPEAMPTLPLVDRDPDDPPDGAFWFNRQERRLKFQTADGVFALLPLPDESTAAVRSEFGLRFYVSFVLSLALAFGIAFELPVVVVFLAMTRIVPTRVMARSRRYVIFGIFVSTALLTPPDVVSQILLALPMMALFEAGLLAARLMERGRDAEKSDSLIG